MKKKEISDMEVVDFVEMFTISDKEKIRLAKSMPKSVPDSVLGKPIRPIGLGQFKGDNLPGTWSVNDHFNKGEFYPVYVGENDEYVVSPKTGHGMKITPKAWGLRFFDHDGFES